MKVIFHNTFAKAPYGVNVHIGFEEDIDTSKINPIEYVTMLKEMTEQAFKQAYPTIVIEPQIEQVLSKEEITEGNIKAIMDCKTLEELETCKLLTKQGKDEFHAFNVRKKQLQ